VIFSIHQPRFAIFQLFDRLSLLAAGHTVFHGQASEALAYFESLGLCHAYDFIVQSYIFLVAMQNFFCIMYFMFVFNIKATQAAVNPKQLLPSLGLNGCIL